MTKTVTTCGGHLAVHGDPWPMMSPHGRNTAVLQGRLYHIYLYSAYWYFSCKYASVRVVFGIRCFQNSAWLRHHCGHIGWSFQKRGVCVSSKPVTLAASARLSAFVCIVLKDGRYQVLHTSDIFTALRNSLRHVDSLTPDFNRRPF